MHRAKVDVQCPGPSPCLLLECSQANRTFVQVGEFANLACGDSVDGGSAGLVAALGSSERPRCVLSSSRFDFFAILSQVLSSPISYPGRQVILVHASPSSLHPFLETNGQMRAGLG